MHLPTDSPWETAAAERQGSGGKRKEKEKQSEQGSQSTGNVRWGWGGLYQRPCQDRASAKVALVLPVSSHCGPLYRLTVPHCPPPGCLVRPPAILTALSSAHRLTFCLLHSRSQPMPSGCILGGLEEGPVQKWQV